MLGIDHDAPADATERIGESALMAVTVEPTPCVEGAGVSDARRASARLCKGCRGGALTKCVRENSGLGPELLNEHPPCTADSWVCVAEASRSCGRFHLGD